MTRTDLIARLGPSPDWLSTAWAGAKRRGLDMMALDEINAEIAAHWNEARRDAGSTAAAASLEEG